MLTYFYFFPFSYQFSEQEVNSNDIQLLILVAFWFFFLSISPPLSSFECHWTQWVSTNFIPFFFFFLNAPSVPFITEGSPFVFLLVSFWQNSFIFDSFFTFWHSKISGCDLMYHLPGQNQPSPQEALVPFNGEQYLDTSLWTLGMFITFGLPLLLGLFSRQTGELLPTCLLKENFVNKRL